MKVASATRRIYQISILVLVVWITGYSAAYGQFEGSFDIYQRQYADNGSPAKEGKVSVMVTNGRIRINGLNGSRLPEQLGGMKTNSVLIRLDKKDFIVFGENSMAVQIKKTEIVNMLSLVSSVKSNFSAEDTSAQKTSITTTNEKRVIDGYPCRKVVIRKFEDGKEMNAEVWITKKIPVNWGMLTEPWGDNTSELAELLSPLWLKNGTLPIFAQVYQDGIKIMTFHIEHIEKRKIPSAKVGVPSDIQLVSFREMLLQKMFGG